MECKYFEPNEQIEKSIQCKDETSLISILVGIINRDQTFATTRYAEAEAYISSKLGKSLKSEYVKRPGEYSLPEEKWDKEYYRMLLVWLSDNYCDERIDLVKKVGQTVYANESTWGKEEAVNFTEPTTEAVRMKNPNVVGIVVGVLVVLATIAICYCKMQL